MSAVAEDIRGRLGTGERVLWSGRPKQGVVLRGTDAFAIPFSLLWGGFAFFWEWGVIHSNAPLIFSLWGVPFVLIGIYLIVGRFFVEARQREKTSYAVTNERILIVAGLLRPTIKSLSLNTLTDVSLTENADGTGTITFGPASALSSMFWGYSWWPGAGTQMGPRFDLVPDAKKVYDTIRAAQKA
jgi:Bacterial PH domain